MDWFLNILHKPWLVCWCLFSSCLIRLNSFALMFSPGVNLGMKMIVLPFLAWQVFCCLKPLFFFGWCCVCVLSLLGLAKLTLSVIESLEWGMRTSTPSRQPVEASRYQMRVFCLQLLASALLSFPTQAIAVDFPVQRNAQDKIEMMKNASEEIFAFRRSTDHWRNDRLEPQTMEPQQYLKNSVPLWNAEARSGHLGNWIDPFNGRCRRRHEGCW